MRMQSITVLKEPDLKGMHKLIAAEPAFWFLEDCHLSAAYLADMQCRGWKKEPHPTDSDLVIYRRPEEN